MAYAGLLRIPQEGTKLNLSLPFSEGDDVSSTSDLLNSVYESDDDCLD